MGADLTQLLEQAGFYHSDTHPALAEVVVCKGDFYYRHRETGVDLVTFSPMGNLRLFRYGPDMEHADLINDGSSMDGNLVETHLQDLIREKKK